MTKTLMIGDLATATGTKVNTIRFYEDGGLLRQAARTASGRRTYDGDDLRRLRFIRRARELGFSLDQVRELLSLSDDRTRPCGAVSAVARQHLKEVERKLVELRSLRGELKNLIGQCGQGSISECRIIDALGADVPQTDDPGRKLEGVTSQVLAE